MSGASDITTYNFVAGWFGGDQGIFVKPVTYTPGQDEEIVLEVDPNGGGQNALFIRDAIYAEKNKRPFLLVCSESDQVLAGTSVPAIVVEVKETDPYQIIVRPLP